MSLEDHREEQIDDPVHLKELCSYILLSHLEKNDYPLAFFLSFTFHQYPSVWGTVVHWAWVHGTAHRLQCGCSVGLGTGRVDLAQKHAAAAGEKPTAVVLCSGLMKGCLPGK